MSDNLCRDMLRKVEEQPVDVENYIQTPYGVAAVRVDEAPPKDDDDALFGSPTATEPVNFPWIFPFLSPCSACPRIEWVASCRWRCSCPLRYCCFLGADLDAAVVEVLSASVLPLWR